MGGTVGEEPLSERLQRSAGLRNVLVHEYVRVDLEVVASAREWALSDYGDYVRQVSHWLDTGP